MFFKSERERENNMIMKTETWFDYFPDHLLLEILYKLPYKSAFKFLSVSKHWYSLISDPCFAQNYSSQAHSAPQRTLIRTRMHVEKSKAQREDPRDYDLLNNISIPSNNSYSVLAFPRNLHDQKEYWLRYNVVDSSNGLLLCTSESAIVGADQINFYICNPLTKQWITLPPPKQRHRYHLKLGFATKLEGFFTVTSYKVVNLVEVSESIEFELFSSEIGRWAVHKINSQIVDWWANRALVTANGLLAWPNKDWTRLLTYNPYLDTNTCKVISFAETQVLEKESQVYTTQGAVEKEDMVKNVHWDLGRQILYTRVSIPDSFVMEKVLPFVVPVWPTTIKLKKQ